MLSGTTKEFPLLIHSSLTPEDPIVQRFINNLRESEVKLNLFSLPWARPDLKTGKIMQITIRSVSAPKREQIELRDVGQVERVTATPPDNVPDNEVIRVISGCPPTSAWFLRA